MYASMAVQGLCGNWRGFSEKGTPNDSGAVDNDFVVLLEISLDETRSSATA